MKYFTFNTLSNFSQTLAIARGILGITANDALKGSFLTPIGASNIQIRDPVINFIFL